MVAPACSTGPPTAPGSGDSAMYGSPTADLRAADAVRPAGSLTPLSIDITTSTRPVRSRTDLILPTWTPR